MLQSIMGYGYPPRCGQTNKVKLLPSRRTTYAGGKNELGFQLSKYIVSNNLKENSSVMFQFYFRHRQIKN